MKKMSRRELSEKLSLYIDGALSEGLKSEIEEYVAVHREAAAELEMLRKQKHLLAAIPPIQPDEWFWQKLSARMGGEGEKNESVYPFSRKYAPLAASLALVVTAVVGIVVFQQRMLISRIFTEKKEQVHHLVQENILQGKLLPLFTELNADQVLQFAMFGTLPLDAQAKTALRVDESKEEGSRIEFAKNERRQHPRVTVAQFCREVDATPAQEKVVDSILATARVKIQESVFLGENAALAVHADLAKYNRTMMSRLAASLGPPQQRKFQRFLSASHSPYTFVVTAPVAPRGARVQLRPSPAPRMEQFVVITPDSCTITQITVDMENLRGRLEQASHDINMMDTRTHALIREFAAHARAPGSTNPSFRVYSDSDYFSIKLDNGAFGPSHEDLPFDVIVRAPRAVKFRYEHPQMPEMPGFFDDDSEVSTQLSNGEGIVPRPELRRGIPRHGIDLDSVITAPRDRRQQPPQSQSRKRHINPVDL